MVRIWRAGLICCSGTRQDRPEALVVVFAAAIVASESFGYPRTSARVRYGLYAATHAVASAFMGWYMSGYISNGLLLVLGLHTHIARCHRFDSETVFSPDHAVAASSSSSFPFFFRLGPREPRLEMRLAVRLAAIWIRLIIRIRLIT